ncbi:hscarg dehydrogenase [Sporothrix schenckii 1099-18]|uniref:Hscarg dehydrogenase n=1 Tax=Sporothrix schenckii 1099-18 TaxID=1397361 RepID=A0A0F2M4H7_SPOSC|nr:hscarg dehydrogenase [Sporothrix schenckii 1099-18]KJR83715.1 hscarg dehydrogenase [Sporothrix schenckii 1099-18]
MSKLIVVTGATGNQGGSVAATFLGLSGWRVRGITRNPDSAKAQALKAAGAEVVRADLGDSDTAALRAALDGAHAIFLNTDFWETYRPAAATLLSAGKDPAAAGRLAFDHETKCRKNVADVAATLPTLERLVVSSLTSIVGGSLFLSDPHATTRAFHPEAKNWAVEYIETQLPALAAKLSVIVPCAYNTNRLMVPRRATPTATTATTTTTTTPAGIYQFVSPLKIDIHLPTIDPATGTGAFVRCLVEDEPAGTKLLAYDSNQTLGDLVDVFRRVTGTNEATAVVVPVSTAALVRMGQSWVVLATVDYINEHDAYERGEPGFVRPHQLQHPPARPSYEDWARTVDWEKLIAGEA